jgi:tetratricopeptide (TPR) repeat protein
MLYCRRFLAYYSQKNFASARDDLFTSFEESPNEKIRATVQAFRGAGSGSSINAVVDVDFADTIEELVNRFGYKEFAGQAKGEISRKLSSTDFPELVAMFGRTQRAESLFEDYIHTTSFKPSSFTLYTLALLKLDRGDLKGYEKLRVELINGLQPKDTLDSKLNTLFTCTLQSNPLKDNSTALTLALNSFDKQTKDGRALLARGMILFRAKNYTEACDNLEQAISTQNFRVTGASVYVPYILSMAYHHLGKSNESLQWLTVARERHASLGDWKTKIITKLFEEEARELFEPTLSNRNDGAPTTHD